MTAQRATDPAPTSHFRSDRISYVNGKFFFSTREGTLEGPYFSRGDAERQIELYIQRIHQAREILARNRGRYL